ncbi:MAG TPA: LemA family protein [Candidatus Norongarragalinales archaeon]|nr:LemA family protein [Candidatus Norongarragalinales archaeon]
MVLELILGGILLLALLFAVYFFNKLTSLNNQAQADWNQIDPLLQQRLDTIPNLIAMAKRVMKQEIDLFTQISRLRETASGAKDIKGKVEAHQQLGSLLGTLYARAEAYPQMRSDTTMQTAMENLAGIEDKIKYGRQRYGYTVQEYINAATLFPGNFFASVFGYKSDKWPYFKADEAARKAIDAQKLLDN